MSIVGEGVTLSFAGSPIGEVISVGDIGGSVEKVPTFHMLSTEKTHRPSTIHEAKDVTVEAFVTASGYTALLDNLQEQDLSTKVVAIIITDYESNTYTWNGWVADLSAAAAIDDQWKLNITFGVEDKITFGANP